ncbi:MAG: EAL domain-containing protein [Betaproteobacteria bacterium]|nr:EAL domain-containing protein [Betaproteobacteria bacterium]
MTAMEKEIRILMLEDVPSDAELEIRQIERAGLRCATRRVDTLEAFRQELREFKPDLILSDFTLPGFDGLTALAAAQEESPDTPYLFVSGTIGEERAIEALKSGATDYVLKENLKRLVPAIQRALQEKAERFARQEAEEAIRRSQQKYHSLVNAIDGIVWELDVPTMKFTFVSQQAVRLLGYAADRWLNEPDFWKDHLHPDDRDRAFSFCKAQTEQLLPHQFEYRMLAADGRIVWLRDYVTVISENGRPVKLQGVMVDITERILQEEKIARLSRIKTVLSEINSAIVRHHDRKELFDEACRIAVEHGGFRMAVIAMVDDATLEVRPVALVGEGTDYVEKVRLSAREDVPEGQGMVGRALRYKMPVISNDIERDPSPVVAREQALATGFRSIAAFPLLVGDKAVGVYGLFTAEPGFFDEEELKLLKELVGDISFALDYIEKQEKVDYLAYYDVLTGLPNHRLFTDRLNQQLTAAIREHRSVAVALLDIERLHLINDSLGRHAGDALLKYLASSLQAALSDSGDVARIGADLFAILLTRLREESDAGRLVQELVARIASQPFHIDGQELRISLKAGVALFPADGGDAESLLSNAEAALKKGKASADRVRFYAPAMNARVTEQLTLENKLRRALEREQFVLYYQPKIEIATGRVSGLEALIRWNDPDTGLVLPGMFIPLLEETGMILDVGLWAMRQAAKTSSQWRKRGLAMPRIAVNVSPIQLRQQDFVAAVDEALHPTSPMPCDLDLEITESVIMENIEPNIAKLRTIREMGVGIAIDDFGTGYSSLSYLTRLPVNSLKIDRSFITDLATNADSMSVVSSIITLAHSMALKVVAEGVETREQERILRLLKCNEYQGYLFSPPLPADKIEEMLAGHAAP